MNLDEPELTRLAVRLSRSRLQALEVFAAAGDGARLRRSNATHHPYTHGLTEYPPSIYWQTAGRLADDGLVELVVADGHEVAQLTPKGVAYLQTLVDDGTIDTPRPTVIGGRS